MTTHNSTRTHVGLLASLLALLVSAFGLVDSSLAASPAVLAAAGAGGPSYPNWKAEYFNNTTLSGKPVLTRNDTDINFEWGTGSPDRKVNSDNFSVRWTQTMLLGGGDYTFHVRVDDGARLWLDDKLLIDQWHDVASPVEYVSFQSRVLGEQHTLKMEYYEHTGGATAQLWWYYDSSTGGGFISSWRGEYFNNETLSGTAAYIHYDENVDFDWGTGSPNTLVNANRFSARWTRLWNLLSGTYTFHVLADDGARLWVGGDLVIDEWHRVDAPTEYTATVPLPSGYSGCLIKMEYYEHSGGAVAKLWW